MNQKYIEKMSGFKATDANMQCKGFQFEIGKWFEIEGDIKLCERGFHFCVHPSGVYCYYYGTDTRVFRVEAEQVLECPIEAGADFKLVCKRIRLVEEVTPGKRGNHKSNLGEDNTGYSNTGDRNTGDRNTGDRNTGDRNTGNSNTGDRNTGNWNTGYSNTGDRNTGNSNTGNWNTGYSNTGYSNTGDRNTGNWNTGYSNTGDRNTGLFCLKEPMAMSFDKPTKYTVSQYLEKFPQAYKLMELLHQPEPIAFEDFKMLPNITKNGLEALHKEHLRKLAEAKSKQAK